MRQNQKMINYYQELELSSQMSEEDLKKELKALQKTWLSRQNHANDEIRIEAEKKTKLIEEAKKILTNSSARADYDKQLREQRKEQMENNREREEFHQPKNNKNEDFEYNFNQVQTYIDLKDYNEAMRYAKILHNIDPSDWRGWEIAGRVFFYIPNYEVAENYFQKAVNMNVEIDFVYYNLALTQENLGKYDQAFQNMKCCLTINPNYSDAINECYNIIERVNNIDDVIGFFEDLETKSQAQNINGILAKAHHRKGLVQLPYDEQTNMFYLYEEDKINYYIQQLKIAKRYNDDPFYDEEIKKAEDNLGKKYDFSKITLLLIPLFFSGALPSFVTLIFMGVIAYYSMRPRWIIDRRKAFGVGTTFDKVTSFYTKSIGVIFIGMIAFVVGIIGISLNSNDYT